MKEMKEFLREVDDLKSLLQFATEEEVAQIINAIRCIVSEAYIAGMNFQEKQNNGRL